MTDPQKHFWHKVLPTLHKRSDYNRWGYSGTLLEDVWKLKFKIAMCLYFGCYEARRDADTQENTNKIIRAAWVTRRLPIWKFTARLTATLTAEMNFWSYVLTAEVNLNTITDVAMVTESLFLACKTNKRCLQYLGNKFSTNRRQTKISYTLYLY